MIYDLKNFSWGHFITFYKRFVTILTFLHSFVSQFTVVFGTVLSVSVVTFSADYCTFNML